MADRGPRKGRVRNWLEYAAAVIVLKSLEYSPRPLADALARGYARLLDLAIPRLRRVAMSNLAFALPGADHRRIVDGVFRSIARLLVTFSKFPRMQDPAGWIRYEGFEHVERAFAEGRGILFATAHLGNWELSAFAFGRLTAPMHVLVRPLDNPLIDRLVAQRRTASGNRVIAKRDSARALLKALAANKAAGILVDQNAAPEHGTFVEFFGKPACAATGFAKLAARSGAAVIPGFALWLDEERRYALRFYPRIEISGDAVADTRRIQAFLETVIREHPDQWLWIHRRWKTQPRDETPPGSSDQA